MSLWSGEGPSLVLKVREDEPHTEQWGFRCDLEIQYGCSTLCSSQKLDVGASVLVSQGLPGKITYIYI